MKGLLIIFTTFYLSYNSSLVFAFGFSDTGAYIYVTEGGQLDLAYLEAMEVVRLKGESIKQVQMFKQVMLKCYKRSISCFNFMI